MRFIRRALTGLFLFAATVGLLAYAVGSVRLALEDRAAREFAATEPQERVYAANVVRYEPGPVTPVLETFGEVQSRRTLEVRASAAGRVIELGPGVEEGGAVSEGQLLFRVDPTEAERARAVARADLRDARAEARDAAAAVALARDDVAAAEAQEALRARALERQRDLDARGIGSAAAVETAELADAAARQAVLSRRQALAAAEARVARAETLIARAEIALDEAERALADTSVEAAFDGVLSDMALVEGGLVPLNERVADLIDPEALEVALRVSTPEYARLLDDAGRLAGGDVTVRLEVGGYRIKSPAAIIRESVAVGEGRTGRQLFARIAEPQGFRPGDFVRVEIEEPPLENVARLPAGAVSASATVLVLGNGDRLGLAEVALLRRQGDHVLVRAEGLDGHEIVAERSPLLGTGIKVRPSRSGEAAAAPVEPEMLELSEDRRAELVALVEANPHIPDAAKARVLAKLKEPMVPARIVERIEGRQGG